MTTTEEIISRLRSVQLLQNCNLKIVLQGVKTSLEIKTIDTHDLARSILGLARLASSYGLSEVVIVGEGFNPLHFPVSCLEYYGMSAEHLEAVRNRAAKHQALLDALPHDLIFLHAQEEPHMFLDARAVIEARLNVPLLDLLGSPVNRLESQLGELRQFWVKRAVSLGSAQHYHYTHQWRNLDWRFRVDVAPLAGTEEAIAIVSDVEPWQRQWWEAQYSRSLPERVS